VPAAGAQDLIIHPKAVPMNEEPEQNVPPAEPDSSPGEAEPSKQFSRREALKIGGLLGLGVAVGVGMVAGSREQSPPTTPEGEATIRDLAGPPAAAYGEAEDPLIVMQRDLVRAMAKPREQRGWKMVIDTRKCVGCMACTVGCVAENKLPPGVVYRPVVTEEVGDYPNLGIRFTPRPCMQCDEPPCTPVCPVRATWKGPDGVVVIDYDRCIGCRYCLTACPYGARTSDFGLSYVEHAAEGAPRGDDRPLQGTPAAWEVLPNNEYSKSWSRVGGKSPVGNARKCHFCLHRLEVGQLPTCVTTCLGRATYFGDGNDPDALVSKLSVLPNAQVLLPEKGTHPRVYYLR
jgi:molybdopterin-containing oxidoreductase family iron-sulfur binding subunit